MQIKSQTSKKPIEFKNPAIAFDLQGKGAISVTPKGLIWKAAKTQNAKNVTVKWDAFANWMQSQLPAQTAKKAPAKAVKAKTTAKSKTAKAGKVIKVAAARNGIKTKKAAARFAASARKVAYKKAH